jgi:hypothetical protein
MKFQYSSYVTIIHINANFYVDSETFILIVRSIAYAHIIIIYL